MLREEFETWLVDFFSNAILIIISMHVTNLSYLDDKPPCFTELPDGGTEELKRMLIGLNTATVILKIDD